MRDLHANILAPAVQGSGLCLMMLTASPDSFFRLSEARTAMEAQLSEGGHLQVRQGWSHIAIRFG